MKRALMLIGILLLTGCTDIYDEGDGFYPTPIDINNSDVPIILSEEIPEETRLLFENQYIDQIRPIHQLTAIVYYDASLGVGGYYDKSIVFLDNLYNIVWQMNGYSHIWELKEFDDEILIEYCSAIKDCTTGIFTTTGEEVISIEHVTFTNTLEDEYHVRTIRKGNNSFYYALLEPTRPENTVIDRYQYVKFSHHGIEVLYEFSAQLAIDAYFLEDESLVVSYRVTDERLYNFEHIDTDGNIIYQLERTFDNYSAIILEDGYVFRSDNHLERRDLESNMLWSKSHTSSVQVISSTSNELVFVDRDYKYTVDNNGAVTKESYNHYVSYNDILYRFEDGTRLVKYSDSEGLTHLQYKDEENNLIWDQTHGSIYGLDVYNNNIYISTTHSVIKKLDSNGNYLESYDVDGYLQFINSSGNFILRSGCVGDIDSEWQLRHMKINFLEQTMESDVLWTSDCINPTKSITELENGHYTVNYPLAYDFVDPGFLISPNLNLVIKDGVTIYDFNDDYRSSSFLFTFNDKYYFTVEEKTESIPFVNNHKIIEMDDTFIVLNEYEVVARTQNYVLALKDDLLYTFVIPTN